MMNKLFLAWQSKASRAWYPVGVLSANEARNRFSFEYTGGAWEAKADGFHPIASFPKFDAVYKSDELFPVFQNRLINLRRASSVSYLDSFEVNSGRLDPIETLALTGGTRATDNFEVFPLLDNDPVNGFEAKFFLHGISHMPTDSLARLDELVAGESLQVFFELNNETGRDAIAISTADYRILGWAPRYLVDDFCKAAEHHRDLKASVVKVNGRDTPLNRRLIVSVRGKLPKGSEPMSSSKFKPISRLNLGS